MTSNVQNTDKEKQLSFDLTLSDLVKKHIGGTGRVHSPGVKDQADRQTTPSPPSSTQLKESKAAKKEKNQVLHKKADIALEGALSRWQAAIEWREANKERLMERAKALYKISS